MKGTGNFYSHIVFHTYSWDTYNYRAVPCLTYERAKAVQDYMIRECIEDAQENRKDYMPSIVTVNNDEDEKLVVYTDQVPVGEDGQLYEDCDYEIFKIIALGSNCYKKVYALGGAVSAKGVIVAGPDAPWETVKKTLCGNFDEITQNFGRFEVRQTAGTDPDSVMKMLEDLTPYVESGSVTLEYGEDTREHTSFTKELRERAVFNQKEKKWEKFVYDFESEDWTPFEGEEE